MAVTKRFDQALFNANDKMCRDKVVELLKGTEYSVQNNKKVRGVDLLLFKDGTQIGYIEVERKTAFKGPTFKFPNVNYVQRKQKYAQLDLPTIFVMFNEDLSSYLTLDGPTLLSSPLEEVRNKYCFSGELFFKVDITKVQFNSLLAAIKAIGG